MDRVVPTLAPSRTSPRDLTDAAQNRHVLALADALLKGVSLADHPAAGTGLGSEAERCAASRRCLQAHAGPVHVSVVWAMYGETGRMSAKELHPHGEDFVRAKVTQLNWLMDGIAAATWDIVAVDDGCPDDPSSADMMQSIIDSEGLGDRVQVGRLEGALGGRAAIGPGFDALTSTAQSRKGGSILYGLHEAAHARGSAPPDERHVLVYTDADLSTNLAQIGSLITPIIDHGATAAVGQRYGLPGAVLVKDSGPTIEPESTGGKPDKMIVLFRHHVRAMLVPNLAHVLDTQAGFKAFDAASVRPLLANMAAFDETFDVELMIHVADEYGADAIAPLPIVFTEDLAATNFPSVDPGQRHLDMVRQIVHIHDRYIAPNNPATGDAADLLRVLRGLDLDGYIRIIDHLRATDDGMLTLFERRWPTAEIVAAAAGS